MKTIIYTSKIMGNIEVINEGAHVTVVTKNLQLKSLNQMEKSYLIECYTALLANPQNIGLYGGGNPWGTSQIEEFISTEQQKWIDNQAFGIFAVFNRENGAFVGTLNTKGVKDEYACVGTGHSNVTEIGYVIDKMFWGRGYGTEMAIASKKYIKHTIAQLHSEGIKDTPKEIVATVHPDNIASKKILAKTLKKEENEVLIKFGGQPRLLFFKTLKQDLYTTPELEYCGAKL